jgi:phosphotransferase system HPr (HPr) family protein
VEVRRTVRIVNSAGLHARPCHQIAAAALASKSALRVRCNGREVDGRSIIELMTLAAPKDAELELVAQGDDAQALVERLSQVVASGFDERD